MHFDNPRKLPSLGLPYDLKLGPLYTLLRLRLKYNKFEPLPEHVLFRRIRFLLNNAYSSNPLYNHFYQSRGYNPSRFTSLESFSDVPIVKKADLQSFELSSRISSRQPHHLLNTGGTSGQPLEFAVPFFSFSREWAFMHSIWTSRGYSIHDLKVTFRGKYFPQHVVFRYNPIHHELVFNSSLPLSRAATYLLENLSTIHVSWIHGYPSFVSEFASILSSHSPSKVCIFKSRLKGILLGSEFPLNNYRTCISDHLSTNIISWFGNSEQTVLALETSLNSYTTLPGYSFVESVPDPTSSGSHLITTSLTNTLHPFIRYDTGDLVCPISTSSGSLAYSVSQGRNGDFILDKNSNKVFLTALLFGRHHKAFTHSAHIQLCQPEPGFALILITPLRPELDVHFFRDLFDFSGVDIHF